MVAGHLMKGYNMSIQQNDSKVNRECQSGLAREISELVWNLHYHAINNQTRSDIGELEKCHVHELIARSEVVIMRSRDLLSLMGEEVPR